MKKLALLSIIPALALATNANAACSDGLTEKTWDKTAAGYCKMFFPDCTSEKLGKRLSYSRDVNPEVVCIGEKGEYKNYYSVSIADANKVFGTEFTKMGVNYTSEFSQWLFDNCTKYCGDEAKAETEAKAEAETEVKAEVEATDAE